jgi:hypothetical protein
MLCPKCGALIADDSSFCSKCGVVIENPRPAQPQPAPQPQPVPYLPPDSSQQIPNPPPAYPPISTYLTQNILLTVFSAICCMFFALPTAITGLVFSGNASSALKRGDIALAQHNSKLARIFMWISFGIEIASVLFVILGYILGFVIPLNILGNSFRNGFDGFDNFDFNFDLNGI